MDTTPLPERIEELASADPADAPDVADEIAATLEEELAATTPSEHAQEEDG